MKLLLFIINKIKYTYNVTVVVIKRSFFLFFCQFSHCILIFLLLFCSFCLVSCDILKLIGYKSERCVELVLSDQGMSIQRCDVYFYLQFLKVPMFKIVIIQTKSNTKSLSNITTHIQKLTNKSKPCLLPFCPRICQISCEPCPGPQPRSAHHSRHHWRQSCPQLLAPPEWPQ